MPKLPFPQPDPSLMMMPPAQLTAAAISGVRQVYGVELTVDGTGVARLEKLLREQFRVGRYTADSFPANLAFTIGAYIGEALRIMVADGHWGDGAENLYATPLPFLVFSRREHELQVNVVEEVMNYLWSGKGLSPAAYVQAQIERLRQVGIVKSEG